MPDMALTNQPFMVQNCKIKAAIDGFLLYVKNFRKNKFLPLHPPMKSAACCSE